MSSNNQTRRSYSSRGSSHSHQDDHARRSSRSSMMMDHRHSSAASVQSNDSGRFSETKLGQMLAKEGVQAPRDFEVPIMASTTTSSKRNLVGRVAKRNSVPRSVVMMKKPATPPPPPPPIGSTRQQDFAQMLQAAPQQTVVPKARALPVYPTKLGLNENLEIEMDAAGGWMSQGDDTNDGAHPTHDSGIILIHESDLHLYPPPPVDAPPPEPTMMDISRHEEDEQSRHDESSAFDADDLYMTEFGGQGGYPLSSSKPHYYHDGNDKFQDEYYYHEEEPRRRATTGSTRYTDSVRSTRSIHWPARPEQTMQGTDPYETNYRDNLMLGDEIEEFHELKREKLQFQKRRRSRFIWCLLLVCNVLLLAIVLPFFMLRDKDQDGNQVQKAGSQPDVGEQEDDPPKVPTSTTPTVPSSTMATDSTFHSDWTEAVAGQNVMRDYVLHPVNTGDGSGENTASIIAPPGENIWVYVMPQSTNTTGTDDCTGWGDPWLKVPGGDMALIQVPMRDTQIVACASSTNQVVAAVHHIFVDAWMGEAIVRFLCAYVNA